MLPLWLTEYRHRKEEHFLFQSLFKKTADEGNQREG